MTRRVTIRTRHESATDIASAIRPDNTAQMTTEVEGDLIETTIERPNTGGLQSTIDDYLCNLQVAVAVVDGARNRQ